MAVAAVVLAAGESKRLGEPKQLVRLAGEALLERAVRVAREAGCSPVVVVLGPQAGVMRKACALGDATILNNGAWSEGMGSSICEGMRGIGDAEGCVLMTCDQPAVTTEHLQALMAAKEATASGYAGRYGVPAYFPAAMFAELRGISKDAGARELLRGARVVELQHGELDIDTVADLARMRELFGSA